MIRLTRTLEEERFQEYRKLAQQSLADDYLWLRAHAGCYEWMATKQWLIEFVYNANLQLLQVDEMQNPVPLKRLYRELFEALEVEMPPRPEAALSKLHRKEIKNRIRPDSVTLFYIKVLQRDGPHSAHPIEQLLRMK